jgi:hypothetical protein
LNLRENLDEDEMGEKQENLKGFMRAATDSQLYVGAC